MILITAMAVGAGATVWTGKGDGDQPTMVGLVLASTFLSPLTLPLLIGSLLPLLSDGYAGTLAGAAHTAPGGFALIGAVLPCAAGTLCRLALPAPWLSRYSASSSRSPWSARSSLPTSTPAAPRLLPGPPAPSAARRRVDRDGERLPAVVHGRQRRRTPTETGRPGGLVTHARLRHERQQRERRSDHPPRCPQTAVAPTRPRLRSAAENGRRPSGEPPAASHPLFAPAGPLTGHRAGRATSRSLRAHHRVVIPQYHLPGAVQPSGTTGFRRSRT